MLHSEANSWVNSLKDEELSILKHFVMNSGSLKKLAEEYNVTYPTIRLKLDRLIQKIKMTDNAYKEPFVSFVKKLSLDNKIEIDVAKALIDKYLKEQRESKDEME